MKNWGGYMNKEECEKELENSLFFTVSIVSENGLTEFECEFEKTTVYECFNKLIKEHFELKEKYSKILDDVHDYRYETHCMKMTIRNLCDHFGVKNEEELKNIYICRPYETKDLKIGMWVWDDWTKSCGKIKRIYVKNIVNAKTGEQRIEYMIKFKWGESVFEENRFFPVQKANEKNDSK